MDTASAREIDQNGFVTIARNPISREGVFQYSGRSIPGADPTRIYNVYRPAEELSDPETLKSFHAIPVLNDHPKQMLGPDCPTEAHGSHGTTLTDTTFENGILYSSLRIFSETLKALIDAGKKSLSAGYRCAFVKSSGFFNGVAYDYVQRQIRGNHISLVTEGRSGPDIAVLDHFAFDHFDLALDETTNEGTEMADENKSTDENTTPGDDEGEKEMTLAEVSAVLKKILPQIKEIADSVKAASATEEDVEGAALDEDNDKGDKKDDDDKKGAMDAAEVIALKGRIAKLESIGTKQILSEVSRRNKLAADVAGVVGTFDHAEMTTDEVVAYAMDKLDLKAPKGQEEGVLMGFLAGCKAKESKIGFALDSKLKTEGKLSKRLNGATA